MEKTQCSKCGYSKSIGSLHIHHIDGNRKNNINTNLEILCANCHYELHHNIPSLIQRNKSRRPNIEIIMKENKQNMIFFEKQSKFDVTFQKLYPVQWLEVMKVCYPEEFEPKRSTQKHSDEVR